MPFMRSTMKRRWVSPGTEAMATGWAKVSEGKAGSWEMVVGGGEEGTLREVLGRRREVAKVRVTETGVLKPEALLTR
jgi:hypothetical protein